MGPIVVLLSSLAALVGLAAVGGLPGVIAAAVAMASIAGWAASKVLSAPERISGIAERMFGVVLKLMGGVSYSSIHFTERFPSRPPCGANNRAATTDWALVDCPACLQRRPRLPTPGPAPPALPRGRSRAR